jgi:hypothetical protein
VTPEPRELGSYVDELERASARLRSGELGEEEAAALVDRCAELAGRIAESLESEARAGAELPLDESAEQERLL